MVNETDQWQNKTRMKTTMTCFFHKIRQMPEKNDNIRIYRCFQTLLSKCNRRKERKVDYPDTVSMSSCLSVHLLPWSEAYAAAEAGMRVILSVREGTVPLPQACLEVFSTITSFAELFQEDSDPPPSPKRARVEAAEEGKEGAADTLGEAERKAKEEDSRKGEGEEKTDKNGSEK